MATVTLATNRFVVDGAALVVDQSPGDGPPVLLLHGIPGWRGTWHAAGRRLAARHRVIIPDLAGFGESGIPRRPMHAVEHAAQLFRLLDHIGINGVHVAGFDFGGPIAVSMVRTQPSRIRSLTLIATNTLTDTPIPAPLQIARVPLLGEAAFRVMMGRTGLTLLWRQAVKQRTAYPLARHQQALSFDHGLKSTRQIFLNSLRHLERLYRPIEDALPSIGVPTLVIWGDADPFFPVPVGRRTADRIPNAAFLLLERCGHFVPEECAERVAAAIAALVDA